MKKILGILALSAFVGTGAFAQTTPDLSKLGTSFDNFAHDVASSLPFASTMGLNWSWSYIGNLPHFGVGLSGGFVSLPSTGFNEIGSTVGMTSLPAPFNDPRLGVPLPAYVAEARLGGILLPFDIGIKAGFIPPDAAASIQQAIGMNVDFHLYGAQIRYELVKEKFLVPEISVGVGVNHFDGSISMPVGSGISFPAYTIPGGGTYQVSMTQPTVNFDWNSNSLDANIQMSKKILLLVTPYLGAGLSYGVSNAGGGVSSTLQINGGNATQQQLTALEAALAAAGQSATFSATDFSFLSKVNGFSARAYLGASLNLWFIKLDVTGMYNVMTGKIGATVGARAQF